MEYAVSSKAVTKYKLPCLIVPVSSDGKIVSEQLPAETGALIERQVERGDFKGEAGRTLLLQDPTGVAAERLLLIGTGATEALGMPAFGRMLQAAASAVAGTGSTSAGFLADGALLANGAPEDQVREGVRHVDAALYRFDTYRSKPSNASALKKWEFLTGSTSAGLRKAATQGAAIAHGVALARDLGNQPPNVCFPGWLADQAKALASEFPKLKVTVLTEQQAEKLGMGAFCAVARGSERDGRLIAFEYRGGGKDKPVAFVGKGITFDTGGISLKPGAAMDEMKYDMCGAASVFGTMRALCELDLKLNVVAVVAAAENMPDGRASRPGDIVKTLSGQTVEILNTDAEGRLVLCDALTWVQKKFKPTSVIDIATLTGACVVALGAHAQAVYANDDALSESLLEAGRRTGDRGWPMPLWDEYQEQLDSPFADMANIGGPKAGSITAACFLSRFTRDVNWAHLDIAGSAWISGGKKKSATGRPVPMLTRYLLDLAGE